MANRAYVLCSFYLDLFLPLFLYFLLIFMVFFFSFLNQTLRKYYVFIVQKGVLRISFVVNKVAFLLVCLLACVASVRVRLRSKEWGTRSKNPASVFLSAMNPHGNAYYAGYLAACAKRCIDGLYQTACLNHKSTKCNVKHNVIRNS